jgi:uncharacterized protein YbaP (TraB family)
MKAHPSFLHGLGKCLGLASLGLLLPFATVRGQGEAKHPVKPLLWKIEGEKVGKTSYLFGTIHLSNEIVTTLHPAARKAFDEAGALHVEIAMDPASMQAALPLVMRKDDKTLAESIGEKLSARVEEELKRINPALDATPFQPMKTWYLAATLPMLKDQLAGGQPLDLVLWQRATEAGKKTAGMEKVADQTKGFDELPEADQVVLLEETLRLLEKDRDEGKDSMAILLDAYVSGEPAKVVEEIDKSLQEMAKGEHKELGERLMKRILNDRDKVMADYIAATLKKDPDTIHFFAAGAAHFCSEKSVRHHLEVAGYKITRIER